MEPTPLKPFQHPHNVYHLEYPAHWEQITQKDGESCGFGPYHRDDVGLWISILPMSVDTDRLVEDLPKLMQQALQQAGAENLRRDATLKQYGLTADVVKEGEAGNYWILAGGDVVLFASSQVPAAERDIWNPPFQQVMASLLITREDALFFRKLAGDVLVLLQERHPDQDFAFDENDRIRGKNQVVYLGNVLREVKESPKRRDEIINRFVDGLGAPAIGNLGSEVWEEIRTAIVPVLKPKQYLVPDTPTQHLHTSEWLADVVICYVIQSKKMYRFVTGWDLRRWEISDTTLHEQAMDNLAQLPWPRELMGARTKDAGRVVVVDCPDSLASSRILHPQLYTLFGKPLGTPFWAGIPDRNTLVLFSDRRELKQRIGRRLRKDHDSSAYPITPRPFLVTRDGIAAST